MKKSFLFLALVSLVFISCRKVFGKKITGSGKVIVQARNMTGFSSIDVSSSIDVYIRQDSVQSVKVETDDNLMEYVEIKQESGVLYIDMKDNYNLKPTKGIKVQVSGPAFSKLTASGACDIFTEGMISTNESVAIHLSGSSDAQLELKSPAIKASLTGAGTITLKGQTRDLELDGTGSSTLRCVDMMAEKVDVDITGSGNATVFASVSLDVHVTGSGSVKYKGTPAVTQSIAGSGSIRKIE